MPLPHVTLLYVAIAVLHATAPLPRHTVLRTAIPLPHQTAPYCVLLCLRITSQDLALLFHCLTRHNRTLLYFAIAFATPYPTSPLLNVTLPNLTEPLLHIMRLY